MIAKIEIDRYKINKHYKKEQDNFERYLKEEDLPIPEKEKDGYYYVENPKFIVELD